MSDATTTSLPSGAPGDLTSSLAPFLDRHLLFPLVEFLSARGLYDAASLTDAKIELLAGTNMVDYAADVWRAAHGGGEPPRELVARRDDVVARLGALQAEAEPIIAFLSDEAAVASLRPDKAANAAALAAAGITAAHVDALYHFAKFQYECGNYAAAADLLAHYAALSMEGGKVLASLWGRLAALILTQNWGAAADALARVRDAVDADARAPALAQLQRRAWLAHWALFVHFNVDGGAGAWLDLVLTDRYLHAVQAAAPHLLRYAAAAAVVTKRRRGALRDVARACEAEAHAFSDPVTEFVRRLAAAHDVDGAATALAPALAALSADFFVAALAPDFATCARALLFEQACRVHCRLDLAAFAAQLGLPADEAEQWAAGLARTARLDARVDARAGAVVVGAAFPSVHDALVDTVKGLTQRTLVLANAVGAGARS